MSTNARSLQDPASVVYQRPDERIEIPDRSSAPVVYPSSGAFQHLPIRRTISGAPAQAHPNTNKIFLRDIPAHCYTLPSVPLNFTIVEIIVFLPNWFKNKAIAARFMNNNLTATAHFMILEEHHDLRFSTELEKDKARKTIADEYRRVMRKTFPSWTKAKHTAPFGWDPLLVAMDGFVPDDVQCDGYRRPASIPFRDLMVGVKKLPAGTNAGDLTGALQFALERSENYMFPDDLSTILGYIGRTQITMAHTDRPIVRRYVDIKRKENNAKKLRLQNNGPRPRVDELVAGMTPPPPFNREVVHAIMQSLSRGNEYASRMTFGAHTQPVHTHHSAHDGTGMPSQGGRTQLAAYGSIQNHTPTAHTQAEPNPLYKVDEVFRLPSQVSFAGAAHQAAEQSYNNGLHPPNEVMNALLRPHQDQDGNNILTPPGSPHYAPRHLLRNCTEGNVGFDGSALARAARFAQQPDQLSTNWYVENVPWLSQLLNAAQIE